MGVGGGPPPFANAFITGSGFLTTSLHGATKGGGFPFANTFITGSERVHMGSVFAGAKILEVSLHGVEKSGGLGGGGQPPHLQTSLARVLGF